MLTILDLGPTVLGYRVDGRIDRADIERAFAEFDRVAATGGRIRVYAEVQSLGGITPEALWRDLQLGVPRLKHLGRVEKAALVTSIDWLRTAAIWEDKTLGGLHLRTFTGAQQAEARAWIQAPEAPAG